MIEVYDIGTKVEVMGVEGVICRIGIAPGHSVNYEVTVCKDGTWKEQWAADHLVNVIDDTKALKIGFR